MTVIAGRMPLASGTEDIGFGLNERSTFHRATVDEIHSGRDLVRQHRAILAEQIDCLPRSPAGSQPITGVELPQRSPGGSIHGVEVRIGCGDVVERRRAAVHRERRGVAQRAPGQSLPSGGRRSRRPAPKACSPQRRRTPSRLPPAAGHRSHRASNDASIRRLCLPPTHRCGYHPRPCNTRPSTITGWLSTMPCATIPLPHSSAPVAASTQWIRPSAEPK